MRDYQYDNGTLGPYFWQNARGQTSQICSYVLGLSGLPDTNETYCAVEQIYFCSTGFGSGFWGSGGGATNTGGICRPDFVVSVVQKPAQQWAIATLENNLRAYFSSGVLDLNTYTIAYSGSDPGYRDYCPANHADGPGSYSYYSTSSPIYPPNDNYVTCDIYHQNGTQTATASLSATPSTINSGSSSALTYSCTNATSATIDNGVGAVSPTAGTIGVTPGVTTTYTLTCTNASGSATAQATVSVTSVPPDLSASLSAPGAAIAGTPTTLQATITNTGGASTGIAFTDLFQRATDAFGSGATDIGTYANAVLANGGSNPATLSYSFPSGGTWYVRVCADKSSSANMGVITESDENNNCAGAGGDSWTPVTVSGSTPAPTCTFSANPTGSVPSTLTWSSTDTTSCTGGGFSTGRFSPPSGTASVSTAGSYTLTCTGAGGSCTQSLSVGGTCSGTRTGTVSATPNRIKASVATSVTFSLSAIQNVQTSCVLTGPGVSQTFPANSCTVAGTTYSQSLTLTTQGIYTLTCDGVKVNSTIVNVIPNFTEF
jgi:CARDB